MSTDLAITNAQIPAHLQGRIGAPSKLNEALAGGIGQGGVPRISIKGSRFRIIEEGTENILNTLVLPTVIVGALPDVYKVWFSKQWSPEDEPTQPDCMSFDGKAPDSSAPNPQSDLCATCAHNAWGSKLTPMGTQTKECSDNKRIAVVSADDVSGPVYLVQVTPAALRGLNDYRKILSNRGIGVEMVITNLGFDTTASFPKLTFAFGGFLSAEDQTVVDKRVGSSEVKEITGEKPTFNTKQIAAVSQPTPVAKPAQPVAAPAPKPAPAPAPAAVAPTPAPAATKPARGFGKPAAVPASPTSQGDVTALVADIEALLAPKAPSQ